MNCFKANQLYLCLMGFGAAVALFGTWGGTLGTILMVLGIAAVVAGEIIGLVYFKCPYCGKALYHDLRLPGRVPKYCPHCGEELRPSVF